MGTRVGSRVGKVVGCTVGGNVGAAEGPGMQLSVSPEPTGINPGKQMQVVEAEALLEFRGHCVHLGAPIRE